MWFAFNGSVIASGYVHDGLNGGSAPHRYNIYIDICGYLWWAYVLDLHSATFICWLE